MYSVRGKKVKIYISAPNAKEHKILNFKSFQKNLTKY